MRRLNRGLFQVAMSSVTLENEEVITPVESTAEVTATDDTSTEVTTAVDNVEVTVKVETEGTATVEKTDGSEDTTATVAAAAEVTETPVEENSTAKRIKELEAELAMLKESEKPATEDNAVDTVSDSVDTPTEVAAEVPTETTTETPTEVVETPVEEPKTEVAVAEGEAAVVKDDTGEVVATVETTETSTVVTTDEVTVEVTQVADTVEVEVTVQPTEEPVISSEDMVVIETDGQETEIEVQDAVDVAEDTAELVSEVDEAEEAAMTLESFAEIAESASNNGGLDAHGARLLKVATEHVYNHMNLGRAVGIPAMESFDIPGARVSATSIAMEDIREQAKRIWQAVLEGIKKAMEWIQEFVSKIFSANARIKSRAEKLLAASDKMSGSPKSKMVGDARLFKSLMAGGKVSSSLLVSVKKTVDFFATTIDGRDYDTLKSAISALPNAVNAANAEKAEEAVFSIIDKVAGKGLEFNNVASSVAARVGVEGAPEGTSISMTQRFPGEQVVWAYKPSTVNSIASFRSGIGIDSGSKVAEDAMVSTLTPVQIAEVSKVALMYVTVSEKYKDLQASLSEITKEASKFIATISSTYNQLDKDDTSGDTKAAFKSLLPTIRATRQLVKGIHQPAAVVASRVVNAALNLATESAKQYSVKTA